jgi:hypothetical protein
LKNDGTVWAWGYNNSGALGDGTFTERHVPVEVVGMSDVVAIAAGAFWSAALKSDGTVWAWGGTPDGLVHAVPAQVVGFSDVADIAAGGFHLLAGRADGSLWGWGSNAWGQLGLGTQSPTEPPAMIADLNAVGPFAAGRIHSLAAVEPADEKTDNSAFTTVHEEFDIPIFNACTETTVNLHVETDTKFLGLFQDGSGKWHDTVRWTNTSSETDDGFVGEPVLALTNVSEGPFFDGHQRLAVNDQLTNPLTGQKLRLHLVLFVKWEDGVGPITHLEVEDQDCLGNG